MEERMNTEATSNGLDAILKDRALQSEFDRRIGKALETARGKWEQEAILKGKQERSRAYAEAKEQADKEFSQREQSIAQREAELGRRERRNSALESLRVRKLPAELAELINLEDESIMEQSIDALERAFHSALKQSMEQRMAGTYPEAGATPPRAEDLDDDSYYRMNYMKEIGGKQA